MSPILASMDESELQLLVENPTWRQVLGIYANLAEEQPRAEDETGPRWNDRIVSLDEIDPQTLAGIHGQLIAYGWLRFQLEGRHNGLMYRISGDGKRALQAVELRTKQPDEVDVTTSEQAA